jgi:hypothetical protein
MSSDLDNSAIAAELPCELSTKVKPEFGNFTELVRADLAEAFTLGRLAW